MEALSDALLCVLQVDTLSIYDVTGETILFYYNAEWHSTELFNTLVLIV